MVETMEWKNGELLLLDQQLLPGKVAYIHCRDAEAVACAIKTMKVRGAPAIGAAAAFGVVLGAREYSGKDTEGLLNHLEQVADALAQTRPTAVNLFWAISRMLNAAKMRKDSSFRAVTNALEQEALAIFHEDRELNKSIGRHGNELVPPKASILTHCNAGSLATAGYGTALGVIRAAHAAGKDITVFAGETRPLLQGARLTAWELAADGIPVTLITDSMAGYLMQLGKVDLVVVGADRITANGDVANKIGTYSLAVLAREHGIPFYVAAPYSTVDLSLSSGKEIVIEEREHDEVRSLGGVYTAPEDIPCFNPAFDVTPAGYVTAVITDRGVIRPPYHAQLRKILGGGDND